MPRRHDSATSKTRADASREFFNGLTIDSWGADKEWVVLKCPSGYNYGVAKSKGKAKKK